MAEVPPVAAAQPRLPPLGGDDALVAPVLTILVALAVCGCNKGEVNAFVAQVIPIWIVFLHMTGKDIITMAGRLWFCKL
jgi:hypothetical protein